MGERGIIVAMASEMRKHSSDQSWWFRLLTRPLAAVYGLCVALVGWAYDRGWRRVERLPGRTVSVGNISAGGTGKSPVVIRVCLFLRQAGATPAILTRGYGAGLGADDTLALLDGRIVMKPTRETSLPDEARMQSEALRGVPVIVGANRVMAAKRYLQANCGPSPSHWVLDDGFQHRRVARDVDLVLLDAHEPLGNGHLLPAGELRESPRALRRATAVVLTRSRGPDLDEAVVAAVRRHFPRGPVVAAPFGVALPVLVAGHGPAHWETACGPAFVVSGIARHAGFEADLDAFAIARSGHLRLPDHGRLHATHILAAVPQGTRSFLTTAKDYWRDPAVFAELPHPTYVLPLEAEVPDRFLGEVLAPLLE